MYKINPFNRGDAVFHPGSGQRGIVVEVRGQLVKFEVFNPSPNLPTSRDRLSPKGEGDAAQPVYATYSCKKLKLVARRAELHAGALALKAQAEKEKTLWRRIARWFTRLRRGYGG